MNEAEYRKSLKKWVRHKIKLAGCSTAYLEPEKQTAMKQLKNAFNRFLLNDKFFTVQQIARRLINNEEILNTVLPIPGNPSYESSLRLLQDLLQYSKNII